jgi:hypothetical protein
MLSTRYEKAVRLREQPGGGGTVDSGRFAGGSVVLCIFYAVFAGCQTKRVGA